jgi:type II secretory pathway pseudopilin PulG
MTLFTLLVIQLQTFKSFTARNMATLVNQKGFTLIETIIYIALFFIIIGGGMVGAYQIVQNTDRTEARTVLEQDSNFILRKIDWAITGAINVNVVSPTHLFIDKAVNIDFTLNITGEFQKDGVTLNSSRVRISNLTFEQLSLPKPGIKTTFTATSSDGKISQVFTSTKYIR